MKLLSTLLLGTALMAQTVVAQTKEDVIATIEKVISSDIAKRCIKDTLFKRHKFLKSTSQPLRYN